MTRLSLAMGLSATLAAVLSGSAVLSSQASAGGAVVRLSPALDAIIAAGATLDTLQGDYFGYAEGPVWVRDGGSGYLLFSDMAANRIYKWVPGGRPAVFLEKAGFTGTDFPDARLLDNGRLTVAIIGSNGLTLDREGRLVMCTHGDRSLVRIEKDGTRTTLADRYEGKRLNGPNDVVMRSDGSFYFTDRGSALRPDSRQRELPYTALFRLMNGALQILDTDPQVNGLAFSPDEKYFYLGGGPRIRRFDVRPDGTLANGRVFVDMSSDPMRGGSDGLKVDSRGNVFSIGPGGVWILSSEGTVLGKILTPANGTNVAFGDPDGRGLFITSARSVYHIRLNAPAVSSRAGQVRPTP